MLVKCVLPFAGNTVKVGKIYEAVPDGIPGQAFWVFCIKGILYHKDGFRELTAIEKLTYYNRRKRERSKESEI